MKAKIAVAFSCLALSPPACSSLVLRSIPNQRTGICLNGITDSPIAESYLSAGENISVLYESDRVLVIDKPAGYSHHNDGDGQDGKLGILSVLRNAQSSQNLEYQGRLYGVHRLDRVTSGILILAKDAKMASQLTRAFREGLITKYYVGISGKRRKKKQGWVKGHMVRGRRKSWYLTRNNSGDEVSTNVALTRYFTASLSSLRDFVATGSDTDVAPPMTCLLLRPYTGRTHQLRVAAKSVGLPLLGDPTYKDGSVSSNQAAARTYLHASAIHLDLEDEDPITVWSPPPFRHLWNEEEENGTFDSILLQLMQKHCDCDPIRAAAMNQ